MSVANQGASCTTAAFLVRRLPKNLSSSCCDRRDGAVLLRPSFVPLGCKGGLSTTKSFGAWSETVRYVGLLARAIPRPVDGNSDGRRELLPAETVLLRITPAGSPWWT